ncbi:hypothetical protein [Ferrovibrio sp.]|uniref:hypothetical protein n=1 Tax=Ferrovibrio sp. TaxID=1917215 RepID=UPI0035135D7C
MNIMADPKTLSPEAAIATIKRALSSKGSWVLVAAATSSVAKAGTWRGKYRSETDWLNDAAKAADVTANTLRRYLTAAEFFRKQAPEAYLNLTTGRVKSDVPDPKFGTVEIIKRIHDISPDKSKSALAAHLADNLTFRAAQEQYSSLFKPIIDPFAGSGVNFVYGNPPYSAVGDYGKTASRLVHAGRNKLHELIEACHEITAGIGSGARPPYVVLRDRHRFRYISPDVIAVGTKNSQLAFIDGFNLRRIAVGSSRTAINRLISDTAFYSSFFRHYWLVLDSEITEAEEISKSLDDLSLVNVGLAFLTTGKWAELKIARHPTGEPHPDRRDLALAELREVTL